jgi:hypothetical protein
VTGVQSNHPELPLFTLIPFCFSHLTLYFSLWVPFKTTEAGLPRSKLFSVFMAFSVTACTLLVCLQSRPVCCSILTGIPSAR